MRQRVFPNLASKLTARSAMFMAAIRQGLDDPSRRHQRGDVPDGNEQLVSLPGRKRWRLTSTDWISWETRSHGLSLAVIELRCKQEQRPHY